MRQTLILTEATNNGSTGKITLDLPVGITHAIDCVDANTNTLANITLVELIRTQAGIGVNTQGSQDVIQSSTSLEIDEYNKRNNVSDYVTDSYTLKLIFEDRTLKNIIDQEATSIKVMPGERVRLEITSTLAANFTFYVDFDDDVTSQQATVIRRFRTYQESFAAGSVGTSKIPLGNTINRYLRSLMIRDSAGAIIDAQIKLGSGETNAWNRTKARNDSRLADLGFTVGTYFTMQMDFGETGRLHPLDLSPWAGLQTGFKVQVNNATPATRYFRAETYSNQ